MKTLAGVRVVLPTRVLMDGWVAVDGGRIVAIGRGAPETGQVVDLGGAWLLPGFVDLHMHGGGGHDVTRSRRDMQAAVEFHRAHGTTRTLVSLVSAPVDELCEQLGWVAELASTQIVGAHLEGPFLAPIRCGAQNPAHLVEPDVQTLRRLVAAARGHLATMTVAPELPGALDVIAAAVQAGVVAAIGHSNADYAEASAGYQAGATLTTHLFNAMPPLHHRDPGVIGAALDSGAACELINDGVHVHPTIAGLVASEPHRLVLVTDAIDAAGAPAGDYTLGGQDVRVADGQARLASTGALAGSTLTMDEALRRAVVDGGLPIEVAAAAASATPARVLRLSAHCGSIAVGLDADFVLLDDDLTVIDVMKAGRWTGALGDATTQQLVG